MTTFTYLEDKEGKFIPASRRPDGTWRKARRVKDGYIPQEEVPLYESKGKLFAKKPELPVGMCPLVAQAVKEKREKDQQRKQKSKSNPEPGIIVLPNTANSPSTSTSDKPPSLRTAATTTANSSNVKPKAAHTPTEHIADGVANIELDLEQELAKKLKKLKKKVREIESIKAKIKSGELKKPDKDQLEKIKRESQILQEIKDLEKQQQS